MILPYRATAMQNTHKFLILMAAGFFIVTASQAQDNKPLGEVPPPPPIPEPLPPKVRANEEPPVVSIRTEEDKTIEEYRQNGRLYMVKITPTKGVSYYYMDLDGDGHLELQPNENGLSPIAPHMWKIKEW